MMEVLNQTNFIFNLTNKTGNFLSIEEIVEIVDVCSIILNIFSISIIIQSKKNLVPTEFWIMISNSILLILIKIYYFIFLFFAEKGLKSYKKFSCVTFHSFSVLLFEFYFVLFFYSFYHLSMIKRTKFFKILFKLTHDTRIFFSTSIILFILFYSLNWLWFYFLKKKEIKFNEKSSTCLVSNRINTKFSPYNLNMFLSIFTSIATSLVYIYLSIYFFFKKSSKNQKLTKISVKFLFFSVISSSISFQSPVIILDLFVKNQTTAFNNIIFNIVTVFMMAFQPIVVLFVHDKLNKSLIENISKVTEKLRSKSFNIA